MNFDRVEVLSNNMAKDNVPRTEAVALALALEFASTHPDFSARFGTLMQDNLRHALASMAAACQN